MNNTTSCLKNNRINLHKLTIVQLAFITAFALTLYVLESFIPKPFPFMKLGLSNIVLIILLIAGNLRAAIIVIFAKSIFGGFFTGTIFTPTTLLSLSGSIFAFLTMLFFIKSKLPFSFIGISVLGAIAHNLGQLLMVRTILIKENSIFYLTPLLILMGIVTGIIIGYVAGKFYKIGFYEKENS